MPRASTVPGASPAVRPAPDQIRPGIHGAGGISTMPEEAAAGNKAPGKAMVPGLVIAAFFFVSQTWLAAMLAGPYQPFSDDTAGNAFFDIVQAQLAGLVWLLIGLGIWGYNRATGRAITTTDDMSGGDMSGLASEQI